MGPKTKELLLSHFDSVEKIRDASADELRKLIGKSKTAVLTEYFKNQR